MAFQNNWDAAWEASPGVSAVAGTGYARMNEDRIATRERMAVEHRFDFTAQNLHGVHRAGSALVYVGESAPAARPNGDALTIEDNGRIWIRLSSAMLYVYQNGVTTGFSGGPWVPLNGQGLQPSVAPTFAGLTIKFDTGASYVAADTTTTPGKTIAQVLVDQDLRQSATPTFAGVNAPTYKIRTSAPVTPTAGDIWIE